MRRNYRQHSVPHRKRWRFPHVWQKNLFMTMLGPGDVCAVAENAAARQYWSLLRVGDEPEKGLARWRRMVSLGQLIVSNKRRTSEPHPTEGCLCVLVPPTSLMYLEVYFILSERYYRIHFQLPYRENFIRQYNLPHRPYIFIGPGPFSWAKHSIWVGKKLTALFSRNYGFLRVRSTHGQSRLN